jgi:O-6-methylguanine DNA methyltransferase
MEAQSSNPQYANSYVARRWFHQLFRLMRKIKAVPTMAHMEEVNLMAAEDLWLDRDAVVAQLATWMGMTTEQYLATKHLLRYLWPIIKGSSDEVDTQFELFGSSDPITALKPIAPADLRYGPKLEWVKSDKAKTPFMATWYQKMETKFGLIFIAKTEIGICSLQFLAPDNIGSLNEILGIQEYLDQLEIRQGPSEFIQQADDLFDLVVSYINGPGYAADNRPTIPIDLERGDNFRWVYDYLSDLPLGQVTTYGTIAEALMNRNASQAVGGMMASNPIAYLLPCHRVLPRQSSTDTLMGEYRWGADLKALLVGWGSYLATAF